MANLSARAMDLVESVSVWHVPPACKGQMIEVAYGLGEDGVALRRVADRSARTTTYEIDSDGVRDGWDPANEEPEGYEWQPLA